MRCLKYLVKTNVGNQRLMYVMHVANNSVEKFPRFSQPNNVNIT